jgi:hypothetical protein
MFDIRENDRLNPARTRGLGVWMVVALCVCQACVLPSGSLRANATKSSAGSTGGGADMGGGNANSGSAGASDAAGRDADGGGGVGGQSPMPHAGAGGAGGSHETGGTDGGVGTVTSGAGGAAGVGGASGSRETGGTEAGVGMLTSGAGGAAGVGGASGSRETGGADGGVGMLTSGAGGAAGVGGSASSACDVNNGGCEQQCRVASEKVSCACNVGAYLAANGKSCRQWREIAVIGKGDHGRASAPSVAMDAHGGAVVVWQQSDGTHTQVLSSQFAQAHWSSAVSIDVGTDGDSSRPHVVVDANGNAAATWDHTNQAKYQVLANHSQQSTWGTAVTLLDVAVDSSQQYAPKIVGNSQGQALVAWGFTSAGVSGSLWLGQAWSAVSALGLAPAMSSEGLTEFDVAMGPTGSGAAVWRQTDTKNVSRLWIRRSNGTSWSAAQQVASGAATDPMLGVGCVDDGLGNLIVAWQQNSAPQPTLWANRLTTSWGTPAKVQGLSADGYFADRNLVSDTNGHAVLIWTQDDAMRAGIWTSRFDATTGWTAPTYLATDYAGSGAIAAEPNGTAVALWTTGTSNEQYLWANRYVPDAGWGQEVAIDRTGRASEPQVALDSDGNAIAVWTQTNGDRYDVVATHFD